MLGRQKFPPQTSRGRHILRLPGRRVCGSPLLESRISTITIHPVVRPSGQEKFGHALVGRWVGYIQAWSGYREDGGRLATIIYTTSLIGFAIVARSRLAPYATQASSDNCSVSRLSHGSHIEILGTIRNIIRVHDTTPP